MVSALIAFANGSEDMEATSVASILDRGGVSVTRAAITKDGSKEVTLSHGMKVVCDKHISECNEVYDMIIIPGGLEGSKNCAQCTTLVTMLKEQKAISALFVLPLVLCLLSTISLVRPKLLATQAAAMILSTIPILILILIVIIS